jgi:hypothetical protein
METPAQWHVAHLFVLALHAGAAMWDLFFSSEASFVSVLIDAGFLDSHMSHDSWVRLTTVLQVLPPFLFVGPSLENTPGKTCQKDAEKYNRVCTHTETADQMHEDSRLKSNHIRRTFSK